MLVIASTYLSSRSPQMKAVVDVFSGLMMLCVLGAMMLMMWFAVRKHREERMRVEAIAIAGHENEVVTALCEPVSVDRPDAPGGARDDGCSLR